jgi:alpha-galactosidase
MGERSPSRSRETPKGCCRLQLCRRLLPSKIDHLNPRSVPQKSYEQFIEKDHFYWRWKHRIRQEFIRRYPFVPELGDSTICLFDINESRLKISEVVVRRIAQTLGALASIEATTDRARALDGTSYAINMIQKVGGYKPCTVTDFEIPKRYGLWQTIADTLGIGGIMRALRTIPVLVEMCHEMERVCSNVVHLNYVNPMAMNCWVLNQAAKVRTVGLCHSVPHTAEELAHDIGVPIEEINYVVAGINHLAFYLRFERNGQDLYPEIRRVISEGRPH